MHWLKPGLLLGACLLGSPAFALEGGIQGGATHQATVGSASTVWVQGRWVERSMSPRVSVEPVASIGFVEKRSKPGSTENVWLAGGGVRWHWTSSDGVRWPVFVETQILGAHGRTDALSGPLQFGTALGWSHGSLEVMVRHLSNAGLRGPNRGENQVLVGWRF